MTIDGGAHNIWTAGTDNRACGKHNVVTPEQRNSAHQKVFYEIEQGRLNRPDTCSKCGRESFIIAHHEDYSKSLEIQWLCKTCHRLLDTPVHIARNGFSRKPTERVYPINPRKRFPLGQWANLIKEELQASAVPEIT